MTIKMYMYHCAELCQCYGEVSSSDVRVMLACRNLKPTDYQSLHRKLKRPQEFIQRSEVLKLYRDMLRCVRQVDNKTQREELTTFIRHDFKANKHHTDEEAIKMLITRGRKSLKDLQMTLRLSR